MKKNTLKFAACLALAACGAAAMIAAGPGEGYGKQAAKQAEAAVTAKVGEAAPAFTLTDLGGTSHNLSDFKGKVVVLEWFNPECPFVKKHYREDTQTMNTLAKEFEGQGVVWIRVNSGAEGKQGASLEENTEAAKDWSITGPILRDLTGVVGKQYGAKRTPEMYVIDAEGVLRYHGAIDNDKSAKTIGDVNYVRDALKAVLAGETVTTAETQAYGCSVKYAG